MTIPNDKVAIAISGPGGPVVALTNGGGYAEYVAAMAGKLSEISAGRIVMKWLTISGSTLRPQPREAKAAIARSLRETVWPALDDGRILRPRIRALPLEQAAAGHAAMEQRDNYGKIILLTRFGSSLVNDMPIVDNSIEKA